jgi:hypothetical protein
VLHISKLDGRATLRLLDQPGGRSIARISDGEHVLAITGEINTKPLRYQLTTDSPYADSVPGKPQMMPAGSIVYLLHPVGEGFWLVWFQGKAIEIDPAYGGPPLRISGGQRSRRAPARLVGC